MIRMHRRFLDRFFVRISSRLSSFFSHLDHLEQSKDAIQPTISIKETVPRVSFKPTSNSPHRLRDTLIVHSLHKHSNSCSTIYVDDSTVSQPNWKAMIKCVSIAIHSHIIHRKSNKTMNIFDEKLHPITVGESRRTTGRDGGF